MTRPATSGSAPAPLLDVHHLGTGATGNETWARCVAGALEQAGRLRPSYAVGPLGRAHLPASVGRERTVVVSGSSLRRLALDLPAAVRQVRPTAVLAQFTLPPVRCPGVVAVHDLSFEHPASREWLSPGTRLRYRSTIRWSVGRAERVLVPTAWTRDDLLRRYDVEPDRVRVAPCAVDPALELLLDAVGEQQRDLSVLCVGTVLPRKNLAVVARAVARLRRRGTPVVLRLVGPVPPEGAALVHELRALLGDALEALGPGSPRELARHYRSAGVLCFPSLHEGFGIPVLEAMRADLPVVCSTATCLPEVTGGAALLVEPHDEPGWADAIAALLGDGPRRREAVRAGRVRAAEFSWAQAGDVVTLALEESA